MAEPRTDTRIEVSVMLLVVTQCPQCSARIEQQTLLSEDSLTTGNTTQKASYWTTQMRAEVQDRMKLRGWTKEMCGRCRDKP